MHGQRNVKLRRLQSRKSARNIIKDCILRIESKCIFCVLYVQAVDSQTVAKIGTDESFKMSTGNALRLNKITYLY